MNSNIVLAFVAGALLASGVVYVAVKPEFPPKVHSAARVAPEPPPAPIRVPAASDPADSIVPAPLPVVNQEPVKRTVSPRTKPSPLERRDVVEVRMPTQPLEGSMTASMVRPQPAIQDPPPAQTPQPPPAPAQTPAPTPPPASAPPSNPESNTVTLQPGAEISVRVGETISTQRNQEGDTFMATLSQPLVVDGFVIAERGARAEGKIVQADKAGRVKGLAHLSVELTRVTLSDGQRIKVHTAQFVKDGPTSTGTDAAKVGGGAALGAIIGAIAGGGRGAGIGAGAGGAAGAGDVLLTRGKDASIPVETRITFRVQEPVTVTERTR